MIRTIFNKVMTVLALGLFITLGACKQETKDKVNAAGEAVVEEAEAAAEKAGEAVEKAAQGVEKAAERAWDAKDPATGFHATGSVKCWNVGQSPDGQCPFGVVRRENGDADVHITRADGSKRVIYFQGGKAVGYDQNQGSLGEFKASVSGGDNWLIQIGDERYEIVEAIIFGG